MANHSSTLAWKIPQTEELVGYSPWGRKESDTTEQLHFQTEMEEVYLQKTCTMEDTKGYCCSCKSKNDPYWKTRNTRINEYTATKGYVNKLEL